MIRYVASPVLLCRYRQTDPHRSIHIPSTDSRSPRVDTASLPNILAILNTEPTTAIRWRKTLPCYSRLSSRRTLQSGTSTTNGSTTAAFSANEFCLETHASHRQQTVHRSRWPHSALLACAICTHPTLSAPEMQPTCTQTGARFAACRNIMHPSCVRLQKATTAVPIRPPQRRSPNVHAACLIECSLTPWRTTASALPLASKSSSTCSMLQNVSHSRWQQGRAWCT